MYNAFDYKDVLASPAEPAWQIEDVLPPRARLDFGRRFLPNSTGPAPCWTAA